MMFVLGHAKVKTNRMSHSIESIAMMYLSLTTLSRFFWIMHKMTIIAYETNLEHIRIQNWNLIIIQLRWNKKMNKWSKKILKLWKIPLTFHPQTCKSIHVRPTSLGGIRFFIFFFFGKKTANFGKCKISLLMNIAPNVSKWEGHGFEWCVD